MFIQKPTYDKYRTLRLRDPRMSGEDVYALQTALNNCLKRHFGTTAVDTTVFTPVPEDGIFGKKTSVAVKQAQGVFSVKGGVDGLAGFYTWEALVDDIGKVAREKHRLATGLLYGQLMHESGMRGGIYSELNHHSDGGTSWDAGVAQMNSRVHPDLKASFTVPYAVEFIAKNTRAFYDEFAGVTPRARRWALAAGAHNAPAWARWLARNEGATKVLAGNTAKPSDTQRAILEEYIDSVTAYMRVT